MSSRKLLAKTSLNDYCGDKVPCEFYLLDSTKDEDYLTKQENSGEWWNSIYFPLIASDYTEDKYYLKPNVSFYTMQNEDGDCLAIIEELKHSDGYRNIELMEVVPTCANRNSSRSIKYVGETMVAFFASMLRHEDEDENMCVSFPADDAKGFWKRQILS